MHEIKTLYIEPGSPWQNGYVESFHDKFRRECLAQDIFYTLSESRVVIADWRDKYNHVRPHRSLRMETPKEFAAKERKPFPRRQNVNKTLPPLRPDGLHSGRVLPDRSNHT